MDSLSRLLLGQFPDMLPRYRLSMTRFIVTVLVAGAAAPLLYAVTGQALVFALSLLVIAVSFTLMMRELARD